MYCSYVIMTIGGKEVNELVLESRQDFLVSMGNRKKYG